MLFGRNGFHVRCFDISREAHARTRAWAESEGLAFDYADGDMLALPYEKESGDCILCRNVISHTDTNGVKRAVSEIGRVLKTGGECYLTLGSKATWQERHREWPQVDENTRLCMDEGPEYEVPHFYADYALVKELFSAFKIIWINHVEDFWEQDGSTRSSFHYHVLVQKTAGEKEAK